MVAAADAELVPARGRLRPGSAGHDLRPGNLVCAGDTAMDPAAPTLAYGTATVVGSFECGSRTIGMTCTNLQSGHGFFISIQSYRTF